MQSSQTYQEPVADASQGQENIEEMLVRFIETVTNELAVMKRDIAELQAEIDDDESEDEEEPSEIEPEEPVAEIA